MMLIRYIIVAVLVLLGMVVAYRTGRSQGFGEGVKVPHDTGILLASLETEQGCKRSGLTWIDWDNTVERVAVCGHFAKPVDDLPVCETVDRGTACEPAKDWKCLIWGADNHFHNGECRPSP